MKISRTCGLTILAGVAVIAVSVSAWADRSGSIISGQADVEVLFGSYHCGMGQGEGFAWASFQSTGDLVPDYITVQRNIRSGGEPQEVCMGLASDAHQIIQAAGCSVGTNETRADETGASINFAFVCHDQRSSLTQILADLGSSVIVAVP